MAKRYYTLNPTDYDFDTIFDEEEITNEERDARLQSLGDPHIVHYRTKTIKSGNMLEVEIYPVWDTHKSTTRARKTKASREAQKKPQLQKRNQNRCTTRQCEFYKRRRVGDLYV